MYSANDVLEGRSAWAVIQGDALAGMAAIPDASINAVITDPPYSSGTRREASKGLRKSMLRATEDNDWFGTDSLTTQGFYMLMRMCALEWRRILKPGGHMLVFIDWRMMPSLASAIESADVRHKGLLVWDKTYFGMGDVFRNQHELILHFTHGPGNPVLRHDVGNVLSFAPIRGGDHPTEKPVPLLRRLVSVVCPPKGVVVDCFAGSGATGVASLHEDCRFIGVEREPEYATMALGKIKALPRSLFADLEAPVRLFPDEQEVTA